MVTIPFRKSRLIIGDSKTVAFQRYRALEQRLNRNPDLRKQYVKFMQDYLFSNSSE